MVGKAFLPSLFFGLLAGQLLLILRILVDLMDFRIDPAVQATPSPPIYHPCVEGSAINLPMKNDKLALTTIVVAHVMRISSETCTQGNSAKNRSLKHFNSFGWKLG